MRSREEKKLDRRSAAALIRETIFGPPTLDKRRVATGARPKPKEATLARSLSKKTGERSAKRARSSSAEAGWFLCLRAPIDGSWQGDCSGRRPRLCLQRFCLFSLPAGHISDPAGPGASRAEPSRDGGERERERERERAFGRSSSQRRHSKERRPIAKRVVASRSLSRARSLSLVLPACSQTPPASERQRGSGCRERREKTEKANVRRAIVGKV